MEEAKRFTRVWVVHLKIIDQQKIVYPVFFPSNDQSCFLTDKLYTPFIKNCPQTVSLWPANDYIFLVIKTPKLTSFLASSAKKVKICFHCASKRKMCRLQSAPLAISALWGSTEPISSLCLLIPKFVATPNLLLPLNLQKNYWLVLSRNWVVRNSHPLRNL